MTMAVQGLPFNRCLYKLGVSIIIVFDIKYMSKSKTNGRYSLELLFGSKARVKILKFMFRKYPGDVSIKDLTNRIQEPHQTVKKEVELLHSIGLLKKT